MDKRIFDAFSAITATSELKQTTTRALRAHANSKKKSRLLLKVVPAIAGALLFAAVGVFSYQAYFNTVAIIDIDVNPSIELKINYFDRVVEAEAYNDDGRRVLEAANIMNKTSEDALAELFASMQKLGYLQQSELVVATIQSADSSQDSQKVNNLQACINSALSAYNTDANLEVSAVDEYVKGCAKREHMTPAKYLAVLELQEYDETATFGGCHNRSVSDIREQTNRMSCMGGGASGGGMGGGASGGGMGGGASSGGMGSSNGGHGMGSSTDSGASANNMESKEGNANNSGSHNMGSNGKGMNSGNGNPGMGSSNGGHGMGSSAGNAKHNR